MPGGGGRFILLMGFCTTTGPTGAMIAEVTAARRQLLSLYQSSRGGKKSRQGSGIEYVFAGNMLEEW
jgi:hypothetical protein